MRDRLYPHCLFHSFRRRWTLFARPILSRILAGCRLEPGLRLAVSAAANEAMTSLGRRCPVPGRVGATGGGAKRERAAPAGTRDRYWAVCDDAELVDECREFRPEFCDWPDRPGRDGTEDVGAR